MEIEELHHVAKQLSLVLDKEAVAEFHTNKSLLHPVVAENIDISPRKTGAVIFKLCQLAKERNIDYIPSQENQDVLFEHCDYNGLKVPIDIQRAPGSYNPKFDMTGGDPLAYLSKGPPAHQPHCSPVFS